jgi:hypothetical protein
MIITHTAYESTIFVDGSIQTDEQFTKFLEDIFPAVAKREGLIGNLTSFYPGVSKGKLSEHKQYANGDSWKSIPKSNAKSS